jgi:ABC-2 type transport system ATP-binding protein
MSDILIEIKKVKKYYSHAGLPIKKALDNISFDIYKKEIISLLGVNGAGKTTLSSILATLHPATEGDVIFNQKSIYQNINEYRRIIGFCPQRPNLLYDLTVEQNLIFAGRFFGMKEDDIKKQTEKLVKNYELTEYLDAKPDTLSGGYKQRVSIARALIHSPKLVILDEPTVGLDPHIRLQLWENIKRLRDEEDTTVLLTTHYLDEAEVLSDRICILDKGKIKLIDSQGNLKALHGNKKLEDIFIKLMREETDTQQDLPGEQYAFTSTDPTAKPNQ